MLHTHTWYSDGSDAPEKYVTAALRHGFRHLGFSDHSPLPFETSFALKTGQADEYCTTILDLKDRYADRIEIFLGMEVDFVPESPFDPSFFRSRYPLDYIIGSVHLVGSSEPGKRWFIDGPRQETYDAGLNSLFGGDIRAAVTAYYHQINELITVLNPDIVGHLDKIRMHNRDRYFTEDEPWYIALVEETLDLIRSAGVVIEANTRGIYKKRSESLFPSLSVLKKIRKMKIPVTLVSDAHHPEELASYLKEGAGILKSAGFRDQWMLTRNGPVFLPL